MNLKINNNKIKDHIIINKIKIFKKIISNSSSNSSNNNAMVKNSYLNKMYNKSHSIPKELY